MPKDDNTQHVFYIMRNRKHWNGRYKAGFTSIKGMSGNPKRLLEANLTDPGRNFEIIFWIVLINPKQTEGRVVRWFQSKEINLPPSKGEWFQARDQDQVISYVESQISENSLNYKTYQRIIDGLNKPFQIVTSKRIQDKKAPYAGLSSAPVWKYIHINSNPAYPDFFQITESTKSISQVDKGSGGGSALNTWTPFNDFKCEFITPDKSMFAQTAVNRIRALSSGNTKNTWVHSKDGAEPLIEMIHREIENLENCSSQELINLKSGEDINFEEAIQKWIGIQHLIKADHE